MLPYFYLYEFTFVGVYLINSQEMTNTVTNMYSFALNHLATVVGRQKCGSPLYQNQNSLPKLGRHARQSISRDYRG